jgi:hypothetical protein
LFSKLYYIALCSELPEDFKFNKFNNVLKGGLITSDIFDRPSFQFSHLLKFIYSTINFRKVRLSAEDSLVLNNLVELKNYILELYESRADAWKEFTKGYLSLASTSDNIKIIVGLTNCPCNLIDRVGYYPFEELDEDFLSEFQSKFKENAVTLSTYLVNHLSGLFISVPLKTWIFILNTVSVL